VAVIVVREHGERKTVRDRKCINLGVEHRHDERLFTTRLQPWKDEDEIDASREH
jgi:hypothetical protein